jgi:hypothetical protein
VSIILSALAEGTSVSRIQCPFCQQQSKSLKDNDTATLFPNLQREPVSIARREANKSEGKQPKGTLPNATKVTDISKALSVKRCNVVASKAEEDDHVGLVLSVRSQSNYQPRTENPSSMHIPSVSGTSLEPKKNQSNQIQQHFGIRPKLSFVEKRPLNRIKSRHDDPSESLQIGGLRVSK